MIRSVFFITLTIILVKLLGFAKEIVVANKIGVDVGLDSFLIAASLVYFTQGISYLFISSALVPKLLRLGKNNNKVDSDEFLTSLIFWVTIIFGSIVLLLYFNSSFIISLLTRREESEFITQTNTMFTILLPMLVFVPLHAVFSSILNAYEKFSLSTISPMITSLIIISYLLIESTTKDKALVLAQATVIGSFVELLVVIIGLLKSKYFSFKLKICHSGLKDAFKSLLPSFISSALLASNSIIDFTVAIRLGDTQLSIFNYAIKLPGTTSTILSGVWIASMTYYSKYVISSDWNRLQNALSKTIGHILIITIPLSFIFSMASLPLVQLFFERGYFEYQDSLNVSSVQSVYFLYIPMFLCNMVLVRFLAAINKFNQVVFCSVVSFFSTLALDILLTSYFGIIGIAWATVLTNLLLLTLLLMLAKYNLNRLTQHNLTAN